MRQIAYIAFSLLIFTACEDVTNTATPSDVTYLPVVETNGSELVELACDAAEYVDESATAIEGGTEIPVTTSITKTYFDGGAVDKVDGGPDVYNFSYSALNKDGIPGSSFRTVVWPECSGDFVTSIAGTYVVSNLKRYGDLSAQEGSGYGPYIIKDLGDNKYQLSDAIGGYYDLRVGYGPDYAGTGMIITALDIPGNSFSHDVGTIHDGFGGNLVVNSFSIDAAAKTIHFITEWDVTGAPTWFEVTLSQVN